MDKVFLRMVGTGLGEREGGGEEYSRGHTREVYGVIKQASSFRVVQRKAHAPG